MKQKPPKELCEIYLKLIDWNDQLLSKLLNLVDNPISSFEGPELKALYKMFITNKSIIGKDEEFSMHVPYRGDPSEREMRSDIRTVIEERNKVEKSEFSEFEIIATKAEQCKRYISLFDELTRDSNIDIVEPLENKLKEKAAPYLIKQYTYEIIDEIHTPTDATRLNQLYEELAEYVGQDFTTELKQNLEDNETRIKGLNDQDLKKEKINKGDEFTEKFILKKTREQEEIKKFSESFVQYTQAVMSVIRENDPSANRTNEEKIGLIASLTANFIDEHKNQTLSPEDVKVGARELAKETLKAAGQKKYPWTYKVRQAFRSMIGNSHVQQIDNIFDQIIKKDTPNILVKDANGIILPPKPSPNSTASRNERAGGGVYDR